jgi:hypothetical protein
MAINLSDKLFLQIKELVERGNYKTFESFLEVAAYSQMALERGAAPAEVISEVHCQVRENAAIDPGRKVHDPSAQAPGTTGKRPKNRKRAKPDPERRTAKRQVFVLDTVAPEDDPAAVLKPFGLSSPLGGAPSPCDPIKIKSDESEHIFGQVNRLFPLKIACRWLAARAFSPAGAEWPVYSAVSDSLGDEAGKLGTLLERWDEAAGRKRDDQLATGLPRRGNSASRDRFLSHFLARVTRSGQAQPGAACHYLLTAFQGDRLALTHQGVAFAQIKNPVLDTADKAALEALSHEEADFLFRQVLDWVPRERDDMRIVVSAIVDGNATPGDLVRSVQTKFPRKWTQSMVMTHVSGLVARLADLRLLRRQWQGRNVQYELGEPQRVDGFLKP